MTSEFLARVNAIREKINIRIYDSKSWVIKSLRFASGIIASLTLAALIYYHGFHLSILQKETVSLIVRTSIGFYIFKYVVEFFFSFSPIQFLKESKWEGILMLFLVIDIMSINIFGVELVSAFGDYVGIFGLSSYFMLFIQGYFLLIVALEIGKISGFLPKTRLTPPSLLIISFIVLITVGMLLLMLPEMTTSGRSMPWLDALFTSISASCVTGLIVVDTATYFSFKGQLILMLLIQFGGLNIISFATVFSFFTRKGVGIRQQTFFLSNFQGETLFTSRDLFKRIFKFTLLFEGIGALIIYFSWSEAITFQHRGEQIFYSLFHSISAFNNAGFALFTNNLAEKVLHGAYLMQAVIILLIIFGGLGFPALRDIFAIKKLRERFVKPWLHVAMSTKIAIYASAALIFAGTVVFWLIEDHQVMAGMTVFDKFMASLFQSVTTRTAGFNTVDIGALSLPVIIFFIFLMFIGGSSGSTAGGIKTSTFTLVFLSALATIRGQKKIELFRQTIPWELLNRAYSIFLFSASIILAGIFLLSVTDPYMPLADIAFEEVSAFCTVGLSTGITAELSDAGRVILMISMLVGRVGTITLAFALSAKRKESDTYKYPKANFLVG